MRTSRIHSTDTHISNEDGSRHLNSHFRRDGAEADIPIWQEALFGVDILLLHASPVYYGLGIPRGDDSAVILIPGFLGTDRYLAQLQSWLGRIGYRPYLSGIGVNAECPNLLIQHRLRETIDKALDRTGRQVHLIGHSLGGIIARSVACQRPDDIGSVITLASPFRGTVLHHAVMRAAEAVRKHILEEQGSNVLPTCYTARCTCDFLNHILCEIPHEIGETAIYTRADGIVDWQYCVTEKAGCDFEVPGTHLGLVFNASVYNIIARRLAQFHRE